MRILYGSERGPDAYLVKALRELGHGVTCAGALDEILAASQGGGWEALVCDLRSAAPDHVRSLSLAAPSAWLIAIVADATAAEQAAMLRTGADAVFVRPYAVREIGAKLEALGRRAWRGHDGVGGDIQFELAPADRAVVLGGERIELSQRQFALLSMLAARPGEIMPVEDILDAIWSDLRDPRPALLHTAMSSLRAKLERGRPLKLFRAVRGQGYGFLITRAATAEGLHSRA